MCKKQGGTLPYALLILLQSVLYGFGNPLSKIGFESITVLWCLGIRFSGAAALIFDDVAVLPQGTVTGWLVVAYLALLCTCLSYVLQNTALTRLSSYTVSLLQCTQPILTAACSYLLLRERLTAVGLTGAAIIVVCVVLENWQNSRMHT
mgnify:CR=1 FL=1